VKKETEKIPNTPLTQKRPTKRIFGRTEPETKKGAAIEDEPAQKWYNRTLAIHEPTSVHFLVFKGSLLFVLKPICHLKPTRE